MLICVSVFHSAVPDRPTDVRIEVVIGTTSTSIIVSWTVSGAYTQFICILERTLCILGLTVYYIHIRRNALDFKAYIQSYVATQSTCTQSVNSIRHTHALSC